MLQVDHWQLPPNPAKVTDSRAKSYIKEHGKYSWELDAIKANHLDKLIRDKIQSYIDEDLWAEAKQKQQANLKQLENLADQLI